MPPPPCHWTDLEVQGHCSGKGQRSIPFLQEMEISLSFLKHFHVPLSLFLHHRRLEPLFQDNF